MPMRHKSRKGFGRLLSRKHGSIHVRRTLLLLLPLLLAVFLMSPETLALVRGDVKTSSGHAQLNCSGCHVNSTSADTSGAITPFADQRSICGRCHTRSVEASHPIGFPPARSLPPEFPLASNGMMTCSTCHRLHDDGGLSLRGKVAGPSFCMSCHTDEFFSAMSDGGGSLIGFAHLDAGPSRWLNLDPYSRRCLMCHDEKDGAGQLFAGGISNVGFVDASNHPIGRSYEKAERFGGYRPRLFLSEEILLPRGVVSCTSCHLPYSREHGRIAKSRGSLCQECHTL